MEKTFGEFLAQKRKEKNLTQKELAQKLFISESAISKWEKNKANPDISMLPKLSQILDVSEHELVTASIDENQRNANKFAKKWKTIASVWELFFYISYGLALLTCFIVNFATEGTLSWFWIVFSSILLASSFTTLPKFIKKYKLLFTTLFELGLLIVLLLTCCLYSNGDWFGITSTAIIVGFLIIFLPIYMNYYNLPLWMKRNIALICVFVDYFLVLGLLAVINNYSGGNWFVSLALPLSGFVSTITFAMVLICRYLNVNKLLKTGLNLFAWLLFLCFSYPVVKIVLKNSLNVTTEPFLFPNFSVWKTNIIQSNVFALIIFVLFLTAISFFIAGIKKSIEQHARK